jgi:hypothetical protein
MKIVRAGFLGAAVAASVLVFFAPPGGADSPTPCPDSFSPVPASSLLVPQGQQKDKNKNGVVCVKLGADGKFHGGPDDVVDDIVL